MTYARDKINLIGLRSIMRMAHLHLEWGVEAEPPGAARNKMQWSLGELQGGIDILDKVIEGEAKKTETD